MTCPRSFNWDHWGQYWTLFPLPRQGDTEFGVSQLGRALLFWVSGLLDLGPSATALLGSLTHHCPGQMLPPSGSLF